MSKDTKLDEFVDDEPSESECGSTQLAVESSRLEAYISIIKGTKPERVVEEPGEGSEPYLVVSTLTGEKRKYTPDTDGPKANPQDTLMIMDGSKSGRVYPGESGVIGSTMAAIRPKDVNSHYLRYFLESNFERLNSATKGSAVPHTDKDLLRSLEFPAYPLSEQRKIAAVLNTVDQAIEKTEEILKQLSNVRESLLQDIFTLGIDDKGNLRSPGNSASNFKKTPLGYIPESWECVTLGEIIDRSGGFIQTGPFGSQLHKEEYVTEGVPVVMPQNIEESKILRDDIAEITSEKANDLTRHRMEPNDVIIARRGDLERAASIGEREVGWLCGTGCLLIRPPEREVNGEWLRMAYQHPQSQHQINSRAVGSTMSNLNQSILESLQIALPPIREQEKIMDIMSNVDKRVSSEKQYSGSLRRLKRGLMQDLFSGTVRTTDTNIDVPEEIAKYG